MYKIGETTINIKRLGCFELEKMVIEAIKLNCENKVQIVDFYFNKFKFKPHKRLDNNMSFIDCCLKYKDLDLLNKYIKDLNISAPNYNVINACVFSNNPEMLKKYIKMKNINIDQLVNEDTPITLAIKNKSIECFDILLENGACVSNIDNRYYTSFFILMEQVLNDHDNKKLTDESIKMYLYMLDKLLPITFSNHFSSDINNGIRDLINPNDVFKSIYLDHAIYSHNVGDSDYKNKNKNLPEVFLNTKNNIIVRKILNQYNLTFTNDDLVQLRKLLFGKLDVFLNMIVNRRPHLLILDDFVLVNIICNSGNDAMINNLFENHQLIIERVKKIIFILLKSGQTKYVEKMIHKYPKLLEVKLFGYKFIDRTLQSDMDDDDKIKYIRYFIDKGVDINYRGSPLTHLDTAIGCCSDKIIEFVMNVVDKSSYTHLISAIQYEKPNIFKLLAENKCNIYNDDVDSDSSSSNSSNSSNGGNDIRNPPCVIYAIKAFNYEILKYIVESEIFNLNEKQLNGYYKFATGVKAPDIILNLFNKEHEIKDTNVNFKLLRLRGIFSLYINNYDTKKKEILMCSKVVILLVLKIINDPLEKLCKQLAFYDEQKFAKEHPDFMHDPETLQRCCGLIDTYICIDVKLRKISTLYNLCHDVINDELRKIDEIPEYKIQLTPYNDKIQELVSLLNILFNNAISEDSKEDDNNYDMDDNKYDLYDCDNDKDDINNELLKYKTIAKQKIESQKLKNTTESVESAESAEFVQTVQTDESVQTAELIQSIQSNQSNQLNQLIGSNKYPIENTIPQKYVDSTLSLLTYPFTLDNYDFLKQKILSEKIEIYEKHEKFLIYSNLKIIAIVYKNNNNINKKNIPCWFSHYGYNIGINEKQDDNHMFSFAIDYFIHKNWNKCIIKCSYSKINNYKIATCLYFFGKMLIDDKYVSGYFEYFINHNGMLFHRLFKPYQQQQH